MTFEDRAEQDNVRRFRRFAQLQRDVDAAARVEEARRRLEARLNYGLDAMPRLGRSHP